MYYQFIHVYSRYLHGTYTVPTCSHYCIYSRFSLEDDNDILYSQYLTKVHLEACSHCAAPPAAADGIVRTARLCRQPDWCTRSYRWGQNYQAIILTGSRIVTVPAVLPFAKITIPEKRPGSSPGRFLSFPFPRLFYLSTSSLAFHISPPPPLHLLSIVTSFAQS